MSIYILELSVIVLLGGWPGFHSEKEGERRSEAGGCAVGASGGVRALGGIGSPEHSLVRAELGEG